MNSGVFSGFCVFICAGMRDVVKTGFLVFSVFSRVEKWCFGSNTPQTPKNTKVVFFGVFWCFLVDFIHLSGRMAGSAVFKHFVTWRGHFFPPPPRPIPPRAPPHGPRVPSRVACAVPRCRSDPSYGESASATPSTGSDRKLRSTAPARRHLGRGNHASTRPCTAPK